MNREERVVKYINSSDDFVVNDKRYCENDFYNDVEDLAKENQELKEVIDKAIKYIEKCLKQTPIENRTKTDDILDIEYEYILDILKEVK